MGHMLPVDPLVSVLARAVGWPPGVPLDPLCAALEAEGGLRRLRSAPEPAGWAPNRAVHRRLSAALSLLSELNAGCPVLERLEGPECVRRVLGRARVESEVECFWGLAIDARLGVLQWAELSRGTASACLVHPREVYRWAVRAGAVSLVVAHNHPSGDPEPSAEDHALTRRLTDAGGLMGIPLLDHVVVARGGVCSLVAPRAADPLASPG